MEGNFNLRRTEVPPVLAMCYLTEDLANLQLNNHGLANSSGNWMDVVNRIEESQEPRVQLQVVPEVNANYQDGVGDQKPVGRFQIVQSTNGGLPSMQK